MPDPVKKQAGWKVLRLLVLCAVEIVFRSAQPSSAGEDRPKFERRVVSGPLKVAVPIASKWFPDADGHRVFYPTSGAQNISQFVRYDPRTGRARSWKCPEANEIWAMTQDKAGRIYFGGRGNILFRYDPAKDDVERVGTSPSKLFIRALCTGGDGKIYGGEIYNDNLLWVYDPVANAFTKLGRPGPGDYVCDLAWLGNDQLLVAMGTPARLYRFDPKTRKAEHLLPEPYTADNFAYVLTPFGRRICLRLAISELHLLLDRTDGHIIRNLEPPDGTGKLSVAFADCRGRLWMTQAGRDGWLVLGPTDDTLRPLTHAEVAKWAPEDVPPELLHSLRKDFTLVVRSSLDANATTCQVKLPVEPTPHAIFSVGIGPDEKIYIEAYQWLHVTQVDPQTGRVADLGYLDPRTTGEIYSWLTAGDELLIASYIRGMVYRFDPRKPFVPEPAPNANPKWVGQFDNDIYRPMYMCEWPKGRVWVAGPCGYGIAGHGLGWIDLATGEKAGRRLGGNAVSGLAAADPDHIAVAKGGQLVFWNVKTDQQDGDAMFKDVRHVLSDGKGKVYALADGELVLIGPQDRKVVSRWSLPEKGFNLLCASRDDVVAASGAAGVWGLRLSDGKWSRIDSQGPSVRYLVSDSRGSLFYAVGPDLVEQRRVGAD